MSGSTRRTRSNPGPIPISLSIANGHDSVSCLKLDRASITKKLLNSTLTEQENAVLLRFQDKYPKNEPKALQIRTVVSLVNGDNTFLLAGTDFGKTRVAELFFHMHSKAQKVVVLVLNPLDALGNNQVNDSALESLTCSAREWSF